MNKISFISLPTIIGIIAIYLSLSAAQETHTNSEESDVIYNSHSVDSGNQQNEGMAGFDGYRSL